MKVRVRHVGEGRTNPNNLGRMLCLREYLEHGFEPGPETEHDRHLKKGERAAEAQYAKLVGMGYNKGREEVI